MELAKKLQGNAKTKDKTSIYWNRYCVVNFRPSMKYLSNLAEIKVVEIDTTRIDRCQTPAEMLSTTVERKSRKEKAKLSTEGN